MHRLSRHALLLTTALLAAIAPARGAAPEAHAYFFGDSDLEQGNFQILAGQNAADRAPYYCAGGLCRDSNGPVWPELLHPGVQPDLATTQGDTALNFAVSGAHMTDRGDPDLPAATGVVTQIARFAERKEAGALTVRAEDRFFIHAGSNDLIRLLDGDAPETVKADIVDAATANVSALARLGAKTIVIAQVQPVQYLPLLAGAENAGLRGAIGDFIAATNAEMTASLATLKPALPTTNFVLMNQTAFFERLQAHYKALGFTTIATPCYDAATGTICAADAATQNRHVFFDTNHLTAAGHVVLADWYRATLDGASGEAARGAGHIPDVLLNHADRMRDETMAARALMAGDGNHAFVFGGPFGANARLKDTASAGARLRLWGGLIGVQAPLGDRAFAGLSAARIEDKVRTGETSGFELPEWSMTAYGGVDLGAAQLTVHGGYARANIRDFRRDTGALDVVATGRSRAERWDAGAEITVAHRWGPIRLQSRSGVDYAQARVRGFEERGAEGLALRYDRQRATQWTLHTDLKASIVAIDRPGSLSVEPFVHLRDRTRLSGRSHEIRSVLIDNIADPATIRTASIDSDTLEIGGGVDIRLAGGIAIGMAYDRVVSGVGKRGDAASLRLAFRF